MNTRSIKKMIHLFPIYKDAITTRFNTIVNMIKEVKEIRKQILSSKSFVHKEELKKNRAKINQERRKKTEKLVEYMVEIANKYLDQNDEPYQPSQFLSLKKKIRTFSSFPSRVLTHHLERSRRNTSLENANQFPTNLAEKFLFREHVTGENVDGGVKQVTKSLLSPYDRANYEDTPFLKRTHWTKRGKTTYLVEKIDVDDERIEPLIEMLPIELGIFSCRWVATAGDEQKKVDVEHREKIARRIYDSLLKVEKEYSDSFNFSEKKRLIKAEFCTLERIMEKDIIDEVIAEKGMTSLTDYDDNGMSTFLKSTIGNVEQRDIDTIARKSKHYSLIKKAFDERNASFYSLLERSNWKEIGDIRKNEGFERYFMKAGISFINSLKKKDIS